MTKSNYSGATYRGAGIPAAGILSAGAGKTANDVLDQAYAQQPLGPSREAAKAAIRKIATALPLKPRPRDLMPADSDDTDTQAGRLLFLRQSCFSIMTPAAPAQSVNE